ncbi:zinc finger protein 180-like [Labrus mixtus]|uniref:zinc finger protein 180-like n=1 Tax=Labrus mixtus TaxID=508554 RepID=UPI0029C00C9E|nr:zinc finger protein 180-like [Labrus mixtus]
MSDCRITMSSEHLAFGGRPAGKATSSSVASGNTNWDGAPGMDGITVVRIDDTHIAEEQSHVGTKVREGATTYYEMEYSMPADEEVGEEEEDVYVIEYSNPEEEGQSYQFTMSVDRSLPPKKPIIKHPMVRESARAPVPVAGAPLVLPAAGAFLPAKPKSNRPQRPRQEPRKRRMIEEDNVTKEEFVSNKCVLELGEDISDVMKRNDGKALVCSLCPPPGKSFKRASGLAVHLKQMHHMEGKKTFFCTWCQQSVRTQIELDAHTKRHANHHAVFVCALCPAEAERESETGEKGFKGSRWGLKRHMEKEHPGTIPRCDVCFRNFKSLVSYLADQFRHVGKTPYHCAKCQIYEITERGLSVHIKNHDKPKKRKPGPVENQMQTLPVPPVVDNSATDDSDF